MSLKLRLSPVLIVLVAVVGLTVYLQFKTDEPNGGRRGGDVPVVTHSVERQEFLVTIEALGTAKANEAVEITAQQSELAEHVEFEDGQTVEQGQLLVQLNGREERARVNELEVNLAEARRQLERIQNLAKERAASRQLLDEQEARVNALEAQLEVAQANLAELSIRAPFAGRLGIRQISQGALVRPGDVITTLDDFSRMKVDFSVAEAYLAQVADGQKVVATTVAYPDEKFVGEISSIGSRIDPVTRAVQVRAIVNNADGRLRPGMLLTINLQKQQLDALVIPESAIVPIQDQQYVFVVGEDNKVVRTEVTLGHRKPGIVQIVDGLSQGQQVVTEGALKLGDGASVRVLER